MKNYNQTKIMETLGLYRHESVTSTIIQIFIKIFDSAIVQFEVEFGK